MTASVNGEPREVAAGTTVTALVVELGLPAGGRGVAVAIDGEVVPRAEWGTREVDEGARVEVLTAMQGG
ncbi:MAG TPA: sulfur carrier protein ThiS [Solirubrobacteraceae bacterium]|jgi:sulfur carrier protein